MSRNEWIAVGAGIVVILLFFVLLGPARGLIIGTNLQPAVTNNTVNTTNAFFSFDPNKLVGSPSGLLVQDVVVGSGAEAVAGKTVSVHYTGVLSDGTKFDSSLDRGEPFSFALGAGGVIRGWDEGVVGMKVGGKRVLVIPSELAYGDAGIPGPNGTYFIPPKATLIFQVELLGVN